MKTITLHDDATITVDGKEYVPKELDAPTKPERVLWTPEGEGEYWQLGEEGTITNPDWVNDATDREWLIAGNIFPTLEHAEADDRERRAKSIIRRYCYAKGIDTRWKDGVEQWGVYLVPGSLVVRRFTETCDGSPFWAESKALAEQIIADCGDEIRMVLLRGWV